MADKTVTVDLELRTVGDAAKKVKELTAVMAELEKEAKKTQAAIDAMKKSGGDTSQLEKAMNTVTKTMAATKKELGEATGKFNEFKNQINQSREAMEKMAQVGSRVAMLGASITAPLLLSMKGYVDKYKESEPIAMRLVAAQEKLQAASERVGRVLAEYIVPGLEKAAEVAGKIAAFVEANPAVAQAALNIGAVLMVAGGLITAAAQLGGTIATVQGLMAGAGGGGTAAAGAGAGGKLGTVALYASAVILGAGVGQELGNAINRAIGQGEYDPFLALRQAFAALAIQAIKLEQVLGWTTGENAETRRQRTLAFFNLNQPQQAGANEQTTTSTQGLTQAVVELGAAEQQVMQITREFSGDTFRAIGDSLQKLQQSVSEFSAGMAQREQERAQQRNNIIEQANEAAQRAAEQHARTLADIERRREQALLAGKDLRDALAIDRANEAADAEIAAENERYSAEKAAAKRSLELQLKQFDAETRMQREADMRKLNELQAAANAELQIIQQTEALKLQIYTNTLAQIQALGGATGTYGEFSGGSMPPPSSPPPTGDAMNQTVNIRMAAGQTMAQIRREINSQQRLFTRSFESALRTV